MRFSIQVNEIPPWPMGPETPLVYRKGAQRLQCDCPGCEATAVYVVKLQMHPQYVVCSDPECRIWAWVKVRTP